MRLCIEQGDFDAFFACPFEIYPPDSPYISPFESDLRRMLYPAGNPLFRDSGAGTFFTAHDGDGPCGRITAHVHRTANKLHGLKRGYFGFFDCRDDTEVARRLLDAAETWVRKHDCSEIAGNFNLTAMQQMGVMTDGFGQYPYTDQLYSPPHVHRLLRQFGYRAFFPMRTFEIDLRNRTASADHEEAVVQQLPPTITLSSPSRFRLARFMRDACAVLNAGFARNPMFVPLSAEEFKHQSKEMRWIMDSHITLMAYEHDEAVGVVVCIPDLNPFLRATQSRLTWRTPGAYLRSVTVRRRAVLVFMAVTPKLQGHGVMSVMLDVLTARLIRRGYQTLGITWVADTNRASLRTLEKLGARAQHRLHLFRKGLD